MDNLHTVTDERSMNILTSNQNQLIVIFYFDGSIGICKQMLQEVQKVSQMNRLTLFIVVDLGKFQGAPPLYKGNTAPYFIFYLNGNVLLADTLANGNQLTKLVYDGQAKAMTEMNNNNRQNGMMRQQAQQMGMQQMMQPQMMVGQTNMMQPQMQQMMPMMPVQQMHAQQQMQQQQAVMMQQMSSAGLAVPQFAQMQQMFNIFTNLQKMGVIPIPEVVGKVTNGEVTIDKTKDFPDKLPDGSPVIKLDDGRYAILQADAFK